MAEKENYYKEGEREGGREGGREGREGKGRGRVTATTMAEY